MAKQEACVNSDYVNSGSTLPCRPRDARRAKYELVTSLRTHLGNQDDAFGCMGIAEDADGVQVHLLLQHELLSSTARKLKHKDIATMRLGCTAWEKGVFLGVESLSVVSKSDSLSNPDPELQQP